jgi:hypothetical protein
MNQVKSFLHQRNGYQPVLLESQAMRSEAKRSCYRPPVLLLSLLLSNIITAAVVSLIWQMEPKVDISGNIVKHSKNHLPPTSRDC